MKRALLLLLLASSVAHALRPGAVPGPGGGGGGGLGAVSNLTYSVVRPTALAASTNDWVPGVGNRFLITASTPVNVTGLAATSDGFEMCFENVGTNAVTFTHRDALSAAANRLNNGLGDASGNVVVAGNEGVCYMYDLTNTRYQMTWTSSPSGLLPITGGTLTGLLTLGSAGVTSGTNTDVNIVANGTGNVVMSSTTGAVSITGGAANYQLTINGNAQQAGLRLVPSASTLNAVIYFDQTVAAHKSFLGYMGSSADADYASSNVWYAYAGIPGHLIVSGDAGAAGTSILTLKAGVDGSGTTALTVDGVGNIFAAATATKSFPSCTLDGASPSKCTVTVVAASKCVCSPVGTTAAIAAGGCAWSLSSTTLTMTSANGLSNVVQGICM